MTLITPLEFFSTLYPDPPHPGQLMLHSRIRRSGKTHTDWCFTLQQATRRVEHYRHTRRVCFGVALHSRGRALSQARRRFKRATPARIRGAEGSVTALPALWARIDAPPAARVAALALFAGVPQPPSILVSDGAGFDAYWPLTEPWVLLTAEDRRQAKLLLARLHGALQRAAEADGIPWGERPTVRAPDLAGLARVPGTFRHRRSRRDRSGVAVTVERFPHPGGGRYSPADFEALEEPPSRRGVSLPWEEPHRPPAATADPPADFQPVWRGCSWLRHCYDHQASLPEGEWSAALSIVGRAAAGATGARSLARSFSDRHPGYAPHLLDQQLTRVLGKKSGPAKCGRIAADIGAWDRHCRTCPHRQRIDSPLDLGQADPNPLPVAPREQPSPNPAEASSNPAGATLPDQGGNPWTGPRVEVVVRAALPATGAPAALSDRVAGELLRAALGGLAAAGRTAEPRLGVEALEPFVDGLEELLAELGGQATARRMAAALGAEDNRQRFAALRTALRQLSPGTGAGPPTARQLGYALRACHGRTAGGRTIVQTKNSTRGATWSLKTPERSTTT